MSGKVRKEESESEYETDSEDEVEILKPVFVPKSKRITVIQSEEKQLQEELAEQRKKDLHKQRVNHTRSLVAESIRRIDEEKNKDADEGSDAGLPDDTDNPDEDFEYEAWKVREILRLKRDSDERQLAALEKADLIRRRNMTDEERLEDDRKNGRLKEEAEEKPKWNFMQKYYHKGVFYMDDSSVRDKSDVRAKEYNAPTLEDHIDREALPAVLQVKNFGKRSRTKYTHLVDQDTTLDNKNKKRADYKMDDRLMNKYMDKRSGVGKL